MNFKRVVQTIKKHRTFLLSTHVNPDPDGLCSELAMAQYLQLLGKKVFIINNEDVSQKYSYIPGIKKMKTYRKNLKIAYDVAMTFDCGDAPRLGGVHNIIRDDKPLINIDHHVTNTMYGNINLVMPAAASTTEVIYHLLKKDKFRLTKDIAVNIYIGIMVDTGSFRYENTKALTHKIVGELLEFKFSATDLYKQVYWRIPEDELKALTRMVGRFKTSLNGKFVCIELKEEMTSGFSNAFDLNDAIFTQLRSIRGVEAAAILHENSHQKTRVNLRSNQHIDVAKVARRFNGGGHRRASGFVIEKNMKESKKALLKEIEKIL